MHDEKTEMEKYQAWIDVVNRVWECGWRCERGWIFISPSNSRHDLSAADISQLSRIEREGLFIPLLDDEQDAMVSYAHKGNPLNGVRFRQYAKDRLPNWAVAVRPYLPNEKGSVTQ